MKRILEVAKCEMEDPTNAFDGLNMLFKVRLKKMEARTAVLAPLKMKLVCLTTVSGFHKWVQQNTNNC